MTRRFKIEATLGTLSLALFALTLFWHDWIEAFGVDPDRGSGALELGVAIALGLAAVAAAVVARAEWRRAATAAGR